MITTAFITLAYYLLTALKSILPAGGTFPAGFHSAMNTLGGYVHLLDPLVPMSVLLSCITLLFSVEVAIFGFKALRWILSHIPWVGGKGA